MNPSRVYQGSRTQLINQLVYFDDEKIEFLDQYFPEHNQKRRTVEKTFAVYCAALESILHDLTEESINSIALIGSRLDVKYLDDNSVESYTIVFPHHADPSKNLISFLSPIGIQLLMAHKHEIYQLEIPSGQMEIRVEGIQFVNRGEIH